MKAGVGYCNDRDGFFSGTVVAETAIKNGRIDKAGLVIAFCNGSVNTEAFFEGLRSVVGETPIIGGSAIGIITQDDLSYEGFPAGAAVLQFGGVSCILSCAADLDRDEISAGKRLAGKFLDEKDGRLLLVFYDSIKISPTTETPPVMNASPMLIDGIEKIIPNIPIIGAGLVGDYDFRSSTEFCGSYVSRQSVVGALFQGNLSCYHQIMHGCTPKDGIYHTVTRTEGPVVYEIDGQPAVEVIDAIYGNQQWRRQLPVRRLTLGINYGEKYGSYSEKNYVNRLITGVLPDNSGIVIFEPDLAEGTEFQFMLRDSNMMIESAMSNPKVLLAKIRAEGKKPVFGLYIDCAGRAAVFSETLTEEAAEVSKVFKAADIPILGFYSGVEIAPFLGKSRGLDWTGVLLVLAI